MTAALDDLTSRVRTRGDLPAPAVRRALREAAGLSQMDVAQAVGASRQAVAHWEAGTRFPRRRFLSTYVDVLKMLAASHAGAA